VSAATNVVEIIDETLRDGPQSLWASRVSTETLVSIAPTLAHAGFAQMVVGSGALFEAAVKFNQHLCRVYVLLDCSPIRSDVCNCRNRRVDSDGR